MSLLDVLQRYARKPERFVIGLMSGTSVDGVDAVLVRITGSRRETRAEVIAFAEVPFPVHLRRDVLALSHGEGNAETVSLLNFRLGHLFADAAEAALQAAHLLPGLVDVIASHGQTVSHTPIGANRPTGATLQIGEPAVIAQRLQVPVVSDFRTADIAVGGQGAPLVPFADWCLLTHPTKARVIQNIGGIGNVTFLPPDTIPSEVIGFDTGPGNMLIDRAAAWATDNRQQYDRDGRLAAEGTIAFELLEWLLNHPFLGAKPPKSAGREEFGEAFWNETCIHATTVMRATANRANLVATLTAFTALSIADAYDCHLPHMPDEVIVGGGGTRNHTLMRLLREKLAPIPVLTHEDVGMNNDSKEVVAFAILANETMLGGTANLPSVTGADRAVTLGKITVP